MSRAFANLEGLMRLSRTDGLDIRPALLRVITDLFVQERTHTREEVTQYAELSLRLFPVVDQATRTAVIAKLEAFGGTPGDLLARFAALPEAHAAQHVGIEVSIPQISAEGLAPEPLPDLNAVPLGERFLRAKPDERRAMLFKLAETAPAYDPPLWRGSRPGCVERLEAAAHEQDARAFSREIQLSLGISPRLANEIAHDDDGEPLLVVARATGMPHDVLLRVLLLLNPAIGQSVERVFSLYRLFPQIGLSTVEPIVTSWRTVSRMRPKVRYQPLLADDAAPAARDVAQPAAEPGRQDTAFPAALLRNQGTT